MRRQLRNSLIRLSKWIDDLVIISRHLILMLDLSLNFKSFLHLFDFGTWFDVLKVWVNVWPESTFFIVRDANVLHCFHLTIEIWRVSARFRNWQLSQLSKFQRLIVRLRPIPLQTFNYFISLLLCLFVANFNLNALV